MTASATPATPPETFSGEADFRDQLPVKYHFALDPDWKPEKGASAELTALHRALAVSRQRTAEAVAAAEQLKAARRGLDEARAARNTALQSLLRQENQVVGAKASAIGITESVLDRLSAQGITGPVLDNLLETLAKQNIDVRNLPSSSSPAEIAAPGA